MLRIVLLIAACSWVLLMGSVAFFIYQGAKVDDTQDRQVNASCEVLSVLLANRADRDKTVKLFDPIRRENPEQFDRLVERAERGDERLKQVQGDLACDLK